MVVEESVVVDVAGAHPGNLPIGGNKKPCKLATQTSNPMGGNDQRINLFAVKKVTSEIVTLAPPVGKRDHIQVLATVVVDLGGVRRLQSAPIARTRVRIIKGAAAPSLVITAVVSSAPFPSSSFTSLRPNEEAAVKEAAGSQGKV